MIEALNLIDLQNLIAEGIRDTVPPFVWVKAEVASINQSRGHYYMELSQNEGRTQLAKVRATLWASTATYVLSYFKNETKSDLAAGMQVLLKCQVNYHPIYGLSLNVKAIEPEFTLGAAELQRKQTIERLTKEGLMEKQKALVPARIPYHLAVISSTTAAGYGDFIKHLDQNAYGFKFDVRLFEAAMQGVEAPESIIDAMERAEAMSPDAILILRGGGSNLDLAFADNYDLAFTIANCSIPVYTAIGHDRDFHVADMVAYSYVKTPTALADIFINAYVQEDANISLLRDRVASAMERKIADRESRLNLLESRVGYAVKASFQKRESAIELLRRRILGAIENKVVSGEAKVEKAHYSIANAFFTKIIKSESALNLLENRIKSANPNNILGKGYALVTGPEGNVIHGVAGLKEGDDISVRFNDGQVKAKVYGKI